MRSGVRAWLRFVDSLGFRVAALLSIALFPLGLISIVQNVRMIAEAQRLTDTALIGRTAEAAAAERALMLTTFGAAAGLVESVVALRGDDDACRAMLTSFVQQSGAVAFAGFTQADGIQRCFSQGRIIDLKGGDLFERMDWFRTPFVTASNLGIQSGEPVVTIRWPVRDGGSYVGYLVLSIPQKAIEEIRSLSDDSTSPSLITFNQFGEVLTIDGADEGDIARRLPQGYALADLARDRDQTFVDRSQRGGRRIFTVVPVISGQVYAMGSWASNEAPKIGSISTVVLYPLLMWMASLGVAYFAVHHLVIRHIRALRGQMRRFALGHRTEAPGVLTEAPAEIQDVSQTFHNLVRILIRDEQELEASVEEKTVLLREVHHRVKNNLQLITSIMNMQIRRVRDPSARAVLKSVQDRVMSLATIHRNLYTAERLSAVKMDDLLGEIIRQMVAMSEDPEQGIRVTTALTPVILYPDQAVPLALLATEAVTNAIKYLGRPPEGPPFIHITLTKDDDLRARFIVENTCGLSVDEGNAMGGTGLGNQLIQAFVAQLEGQIDNGITSEGHYRLSVEFAIDETLDS